MADTDPNQLPSVCVESATLAAFVEGRLDTADRARVVAHLASCPDCTELAGGVIAVEETLANEPAPVQSRPEPVVLPHKPFWSRRRGMAAVGGFAALAASIVLLMLGRESPRASLVSIVGDERLTIARPTGEFRYGPLRPRMRGTGESASLSLLAEAARLRERADKTGATSDVHAAGVAQLLAGDTAAGIAALESAAQAKPEDAEIQSDLGAGYMTRFIDTGNQGDAAAALAAFQRALGLNPTLKEALFNKAVLLMRLGRPAESLSAWNAYLALPAEPGWRDEAVRERQAALERAR